MLHFLAGLAAAALQTPGDPCAGDSSCRQANAAQLFDLADELFGKGDFAGAEDVLVALTQDPHPELRAEARFRLAALREKRGDLSGATAALRELLAEQPDANRARLELGRLLALQGNTKAARKELAQAEARGLPDDVARTVKSFSASLPSEKRRGLSLDMAFGPDSNINRSTRSQYVDTVIAPFELDPDARGQSGMGLSLGGQAFSRDDVLGATLLTRAGAHGDFFAKGRFNDIQFAASTGPEFKTRIGQLRPALTHERRWYGGDAYSSGTGVMANWLISAGKSAQVEFEGSAIRQSIRDNPFLDGYRYFLSGAYDRAFSPRTSARFVARASALDAEAEPESLRQAGLDALLAHNLGRASLFVQGGFTKTRGREPLALFGKTRDDDRFDVGGGIIAHGLSLSGFAPLLRLTYTNSHSNLELYDYRRTRIDFGFTRDF